MDTPAGLAGETIGRYDFRERLGGGRYGSVYRARDLKLCRDVAVKTSEPQLSDPQGGLEALMKEARIQARLEHANIVPIHDVFENGNRLFIVMRLAQGEDLGKRIQNRGKHLEPVEAVAFMRQVLDAVGFAHAKGVIHGDLKPGNIQVTPEGEALVLDFGAARMRGDPAADPDDAVGTPTYVSPEQIRGDHLDARSDIYALGISVYKMVTGRHPFHDARDIPEMLNWHLERQPESPRAANPDLTPDFADAIMRAINKDPRERFRSCREFAEALEGSLDYTALRTIRPADVRWDPRADIVLAAKLQAHASRDVFAARTLDLSVGGVAVRSPAGWPAGTIVRSQIYLASGTSPVVIEANARVVWVRPEPGFDTYTLGMRFVKLSRQDRSCIGDFVREALVMGEDFALMNDTVLGA